MSLRKAVVVDYGIGNVFSVCNAISHAGGEPILTDNQAEIANADRLVLPGVGAFGKAMEQLRRRDLIRPILSFCATERPFLGICIGMQVLMERSSEMGQHAGLALFAGSVERLPGKVGDTPLRVPHIGWNSIGPSTSNNRWKDTVCAPLKPYQSSLYFVHSYEARPADPKDILATADYEGYRVTAAIQRNNLTGVQFHPERSGVVGQRLLRCFLSM